MARRKNVSVKIEAGLYSQASAVFKERGTTLENWLALQLRAFVNNSGSLLRLKDKIPFGKYCGATVEDVVRGDLRYMTWILSQDFSCKYDPEVHSLVEELNS